MIINFIYILHLFIFLFSAFGILLLSKCYYKYLLINKLIIVYLWLIYDGCILRKLENNFENDEDKNKSFFYKIMEYFKLNHIIDKNKYFLNIIINLLITIEIFYFFCCLNKINIGIFIIFTYYLLNLLFNNKILMETI